MTEIERKWRLWTIPYDQFRWEFSIEKEISQGYLFDQDGFEIRIRKSYQKSNDWLEYTLTLKSGGGIEREEFEVKISKFMFDNMFSIIKDGSTITKYRLTAPRVLPRLELDIYYGKLDGLVILEHEFDTIEEANNFVIPSWIVGTEVTDDPQFKNKNLAKLKSILQLPPIGILLSHNDAYQALRNGETLEYRNEDQISWRPVRCSNRCEFFLKPDWQDTDGSWHRLADPHTPGLRRFWRRISSPSLVS